MEKIFVGDKTFEAGRIGDKSSLNFQKQLKTWLSVGRLKTGTPPRLLRNTINWNLIDLQSADENPVLFSYLT